ncbi:MAG: ribonuclease D [Lysobacteraceae bacterium]|jgi:ribonuclease D|nr:ribonuclease D [Xanthomonadaceae bacterium]MCZ8318235.1 ribonuclease D [Silanimonas sp.]
MSHIPVESIADLHEATGPFEASAALALDTEFMRERTWYPQLALVQIADARGRIVLVDPLADGVREALAPVVGAADALMHSASEDLVAFRHALGVLPRRLFDTQIAAAFAGLGAGVGYQSLVQQVLGVTLEKAETRSDWLRRPLSERQLAYAADDVRHLHAVAEALEARLSARGHAERAAADMDRMLELAREERDDPQPHLAFRPAAQLDRAGQVRLRRLLRWRDATARRKDLPKRWLLDNDIALALARRPPANAQALAALLEGGRSARRLQDEIAMLLEAPLDADEATMPLATDTERTDRQRLKTLQAVVADRAAALDLPDGLLCARRHLEALLADGQWPRALDGWRQDVLEGPLRRVLG